MGRRRDATWTRCVVLVMLAAISACRAVASRSRPSWTGSGGVLLAPPPAKVRTLLVLEVDMTEPVEDFLACTFQAHLPSVANIALDVLVALSGHNSADENWEQLVFEMIKRTVSNAMVVQPAFYKATMLPAEDDVDDDEGIEPTLKVNSLLAFLDDPSGQQTYDQAVIMDSQVCALRVGWLDVALAPVLGNPKTWLSGAPLQNECTIWSKQSAPACRQNPNHADSMAGILSLHVSGQGRKLLDYAEQHYGNLPVTKAILAAVMDRNIMPADAISANSRLLALHAPMDESLFKDAAYYGLETRLALVHAPRRLAVPGPAALAARLDLRQKQHAIAIALPPAGVPDMQSLIKSTRTSYIYAGIPTKNIVFLACSRQGLIEASSLAAFQVLMMTPSPGHADPCSGGAVLETAASLVRAGAHSMLIAGLDAFATGSARAALSSLQKVDKDRPIIYLPPEAEAPMQAFGLPVFSSPIYFGAIYVSSSPGKVEDAASALSSWAAALEMEKRLSRLSSEAVLSPRVIVSTLPETKFAWAGNGRFLMSLKNCDARKSKTAIVYSTGFVSSSMAEAPGPLPLADWAATMAFRHRTLGLWTGGPGPICTTYSAVSRKPLLLDSVRAVSRAVRRVADFMVFARKHQLDCAVFPGFVLGGPHGPVVPFDAVLDAKAVRALAGPRLVLYPRFTDMDANANGFVPFHCQRGRKVDSRHVTVLHERPGHLWRWLRTGRARLGQPGHAGSKSYETTLN